MTNKNGKVLLGNLGVSPQTSSLKMATSLRYIIVVGGSFVGRVSSFRCPTQTMY